MSLFGGNIFDAPKNAVKVVTETVNVVDLAMQDVIGNVEEVVTNPPIIKNPIAAVSDTFIKGPFDSFIKFEQNTLLFLGVGAFVLYLVFKDNKPQIIQAVESKTQGILDDPEIQQILQ